jgi:hypothetical protein
MIHDDHDDFLYGSDGTLDFSDEQTNVEDLFNSEDFDENDENSDFR